MRRDMDVIRKIVLAVANAPGEKSVNGVEGVNEEVFNAHAQLLMEAGLVSGSVAGGKNGAMPKGYPLDAIIFRLTWDGHDFADSIRDDTIWNKVRSSVLEPSASWTFGILKEVLKAEIKRHIPGIEA